MTQPILHLDSVALCYRLPKQRIGSIKEYFIHLVKGNLVYEKLWALRDIELSVAPGEFVGVVGPNGAGKSTLAKVISGVLKPTRGERSVRGRISPILELTTGFDFELTGYENIFLNGLLLGRTRREVKAALDSIIDFSGLQEFIHTPIRNYSSGMVARLGFSIATAWIPELLILDEVLAVGDARFVRRCQERIKGFQEAGTTTILVSHASELLRESCSRCLWLERGRLVADGEPGDVLDRYEEAMRGPREPAAAEEPPSS